MQQTACITCNNDTCLFKNISSVEYVKQFYCKAGQHIFLEVMPVKGFYIVQHGAVEEFYFDSNDKKIITHTAIDGEIFGHTDYSGIKHSHNAVATENTEICFIGKDILYKVCKANPELSLNLMNFFLEQFNKSDIKGATWIA